MVLIVAIVVGLAAVTLCVFAWRSRTRRLNLEMSWTFRRKLALLAHRIERDEEAPTGLVELTSWAADNAFNSDMFRQLNKLRSKSEKRLKRVKWSEIVKIPIEYEEDASEVMRLFAYIAMCEDHEAGKVVRLAEDYTRKRLKAKQTNWRRSLEHDAIPMVPGGNSESMFGGSMHAHG